MLKLIFFKKIGELYGFMNSIVALGNGTVRKHTPYVLNKQQGMAPFNQRASFVKAY
jgi:hypothetical protein